ncbi:hypothetical protein [Kinneretia aquatilis]|uniref:hypothetical protein n=1 Tax=Kinneretia aquatilis TaxID=2070761 RepID=UPI0010570BDF|nr:hypothetical protein [Paucibacter aquatile]
MNDHFEGISVGTTGQFQVHFILRDGSHNMDALVLHGCEGELLGLLREIGKQLDIDFHIDATAYAEGGLSVHLSLLGKHAVALTLLGAAITAICSAGVWMTYQRELLQQQILQNDFALNRDRKLADQQVEMNDLAIKKARLELKKMEQEATGEAPKMPSTAATRPLPLEPVPTAEDVVPALLSNPKIIKLRSQFYQHLLPYEKVSSVGFSPSHDPSPRNEMIVHRASFSTYVVALRELDPTVIRDAEIEIVSPVFKRDAFKWKGVFEKHGISFDLIDEDFLAKVTAKKVKFQSGTTLVCDLEIFLRETGSGTPEPYKWVVTHVNRYYNKKGTIAPNPMQSVITTEVLEQGIQNMQFAESPTPVQNILPLERE